MNNQFLTPVMQLSQGNPGAASALCDLIGNTEKFQHHFPISVALGTFIDLNIYGTSIYILYSDLCGKDQNRVMAVLYAYHKGLIKGEDLKDACSKQDYSGRNLIDIDTICNLVAEEVPGTF